MSVSTDYDYTRFTPMDNTGESYDYLRSAYKNIRFALPTARTITITEPDVGNLVGIAFRFYGDTSLWRMLLAFNGLVCPIQDMWPGQILKMPAKSAVIAYLNEQTQTKQQTFSI